MKDEGITPNTFKVEINQDIETAQVEWRQEAIDYLKEAFPRVDADTIEIAVEWGIQWFMDCSMSLNERFQLSTATEFDIHIAIWDAVNTSREKLGTIPTFPSGIPYLAYIHIAKLTFLRANGPDSDRIKGIMLNNGYSLKRGSLLSTARQRY